MTVHEPIRLGPITVTFSVDADASNGAVTVSRCDAPNGTGIAVAHSHDAFEETIYGLEGTTSFTIDGEVVEIAPGDGVCIQRGVVHSFMAEKGDVSFLTVATPGVFGPAYFHELAAVLNASAGGPPDPAAIQAVMLRHGLTPA